MTDPVIVSGRGAGGNRRLFILLGAGAALLVAVLAFRALSGGGSSEVVDEATATTAVAGDPGSGAVDGTTTSTTTSPVQTYEVFTTKNPFRSLVPTDVAEGATAGGSSGESGATTETTVVGGASGTDTAPAVQQRISLVDVYVGDDGATVASVRVNDVVHNAAVGQRFATNYQVVSVSTSTGCGQFLYGDEQFQLCRGQELVK